MNNIVEISEESIKELAYISNEPKWFTNYRLLAFEKFKKLPFETSPLYVKHYDISGMDLKNAKLDFTMDKTLPSVVEDFLKRLNYVPYIFFLDGRLYSINIPDLLNKEGLSIESIKNFLGKEERIKELLKIRQIENDDDKFAALNNALFHEGFYIYIPAGMQLKVPLRIINVVTKENILSFNQNFIIVGADANLAIIEEDYSLGNLNSQSLMSKNLNVILRENAKLEYVYINGYEENVNGIIFRRCICEKDASIAWYSGFFGGLVTRVKTDNRMHSQGSTSNNIEIILGEKKQRFDLTAYLSHIATYTKSVSLTRGALKGESRALFKGMIKIYENAKNSDAYLAEHAMILNKGARADSIPGLEIANNEVRATHSASVAQIDEEQIFYLMSRGLSEQESKKLLTVSFFQQLIDQIPIEDVKTKFMDVIESKLDDIKIPIENKFVLTHELKEAIVITPEKLFQTHYKYRK